MKRKSTNLPVLSHRLTIGIDPGSVRFGLVLSEVGQGGDHVKVQSDRLLVAIVNLIMDSSAVS